MIFAVISDIHIEKDETEEDRKFKNALNIINKKAPNLDALIIAGDLTNSGYAEQYDRFMTIYNGYANKKAEKLFVIGNHDYWNGLTAKLSQQLFKEKVGVGLQTHKIIKGYHFIQVSTEDKQTAGYFSEKLVKWLRGELEKAKNDNPKKPIFVTVHQHIKHTVYGSDDWGNPSLNEVLRDYPQVITFSGHSHYAINDERSIHQKDFTSIGTGSLSYIELEKGKIGGSVPEGAGKVSVGLLVNVDENNKVTVERLDFTNEETFKPNWIIENPSDKTSFKYTDSRRISTQKPYFQLGSKIDVDNITKDSAQITFPQAKHETLVHSYKINVKNETTGILENQFLIFSGFYLGSKMPKTLTVDIPNLKEGNEYKIQVFAIESFGKESWSALEVEFWVIDK